MPAVKEFWDSNLWAYLFTYFSRKICRMDLWWKEHWLFQTHLPRSIDISSTILTMFKSASKRASSTKGMPRRT